jgi:hypothetical protein
VSRGVADVFRDAGERYIAAFIESLPTEEDRSRFFDAARTFLSFDWKIRNLPPGRRRNLLHANGSNLATALWQAAQRLLGEDHPSENNTSVDIQLFGARLLMARVIVEGFRGASDRKALLEAALLLRELGDDAQNIRSKSEAKNARREALADDSAPHAQRVARLRMEAERLRRERPHLQSQRDRAAKLNRRFQKHDLQHWPSTGALIEFARRNGIKL